MNYNSIWLKFKNWSLLSGIILFLGMHVVMFWFKILPNNAALFYNMLYLPLISISLLLFFPVCSSWIKGHLFKRQITFISILSYAIYLINYSIVLLTIQYFIDLEEASYLIKFLMLILFWISTIGLAYILYQFFEKPIMGIRDLNIIKQKFID